MYTGAYLTLGFLVSTSLGQDQACEVVDDISMRRCIDLGHTRLYSSKDVVEVRDTIWMPAGSNVDFAGLELKAISLPSGPVLGVGRKGSIDHGTKISNVKINGNAAAIAEEKNDTTGYTRSCIEVNSRHSVEIVDSEFRDCRSGGIVAGDPAVSLIISRNKISAPVYDCIAIDGEWSGVLLSDNILTAAPFAAISLDTRLATVTVQNNTIDGRTSNPRPGLTQGDVGVFMRDVGSLNLKGNKFDNVNHGVFVGIKEAMRKVLIALANTGNALSPLSGDFSGVTVVTDERGPRVFATDANTNFIEVTASWPCSSDCGNGRCLTNAVQKWCVCYSGFTGAKCGEKTATPTCVQKTTTTTPSPSSSQAPIADCNYVPHYAIIGALGGVLLVVAITIGVLFLRANHCSPEELSTTGKA